MAKRDGQHRPLIPILATVAISLCVPATRGADPADTGIPLPSAPEPAVPDAEEPSPVPDDATLEASGAIVGSILLHPGEIFEDENGQPPNRLFRAANHLHIRTRESTLRAQLTFKEGDRYSRAALAESERILRKSGYLYDAVVRPIAFDGTTVTVEVATRDTWTTKAGIGFKRSGGVNKTHIGLTEGNFLGLGKHLEARRTSDVDRTETLFQYTDRNLGGSRLLLDAAYSNNSDGDLKALEFARPFYSLDARWAAGVRGERSLRIDSLYALGEITEQFNRHHEGFEAYFGRSPGLVGGTSRRFTTGFTWSRDQFDPLPDPGATHSVPPDRALAYPWVGIDFTRDGFIRAHDMDKMGRTEDLNLSHDLHARLGWSSPAFGGDRNEAIVELGYRNGLNPGNGQILLLSTSASGRLSGGSVADGLLEASARYFYRGSENRLFYMGLFARGGANPDPDHQLLLGGDNGLRGYPLRYATGERTALFTIEQRFYWAREHFHLVRVGGAVFADVGEAWGGTGSPATQLDVLRDVGFGLRIGQTRSAHAGMVRIDVAFPLDGGPSISRTQLLITTGETF